MLNVFFFLFAVAASVLLGCRHEDFVEENVRKITQEQWWEISVGMDKTNVVSILGVPAGIVPGDSKQEEYYFYRPKGEIFSSAEKNLVVSSFVVIFSSNKVTRTFVAYESPEQRRREEKSRKKLFWRTQGL